MEPNDEMKRYVEAVRDKNLYRRSFVERYFSFQGVGVEVGVLFGDFSALLLETLIPTRLYLVDPWFKFAICRTTDAEDAFKYVSERFEDDHRVEVLRLISVDAVVKFKDESLDFVYIDGDHSFNSCTTDLRIWWPKVKKCGVMAGDDFCVNRKGQPFGTVQAVKNFLANGGVCEEFHLYKDQFAMVK